MGGDLDCSYCCNQFTGLVGVVVPWGVYCLISWVVLTKPYSFSAFCVLLTIVVAGSICVDLDLVMSSIGSFCYMSLCGVLGESFWVCEDLEAFGQVIFACDCGVEQDFPTSGSCKVILEFPAWC